MEMLDEKRTHHSNSSIRAWRVGFHICDDGDSVGQGLRDLIGDRAQSRGDFRDGMPIDRRAATTCAIF
jgi:hypothetical protein